MALCLASLGNVAQLRADVAATEALLTTTKAHLTAAALALLLPVGQFLAQQGKQELGHKVLTCVLLNASTPLCGHGARAAVA
jgi:hypothetical protein